MWRTEINADKSAQKSLARYFDVVRNRKIAKFLIAEKVSSEFDYTDSLETLWKKHYECEKEFLNLQNQIYTGQPLSETDNKGKSYFDLKIQIANRLLQSCCLCNRRCSVNRLLNGSGYCRCGNTLSVSTIFIHTGEEPELVPSETVFTLGCTIRCLHCQNWTISQWQETPKEYDSKQLAEDIENLHGAGSRNINLVGGDPTPWLKHWLEVFSFVTVNVPVVWNSNSYYSPETSRLLNGFVDVYLLDFKYGPGECSRTLSDAPDYWQVCTRNHIEAKRNGDLIVRILVLPGHLECCTKPILNWIAENLGKQTRVNLMFQFRPAWRSNEIPELNRRLTKAEIDFALNLAKQAGLENLV